MIMIINDIKKRYLINKSKVIKGCKINTKRYYSIEKSNSVRKKIWIDINIINLNDLDSFKNQLFYSNKLKKDTTYCILLKLRKGDIYYMIDEKQKSFRFNSINDNSFEDLFNLIQDRLLIIFEEYKFELNYQGDSILLDFWSININKNNILYNIDKINELSKSELININKGRNYFGTSLFENEGIPLKSKIWSGKLEITSKDNLKNMDKFIEKFNNQIECNNKNYFINENSKLSLINYHNKQFIIILDNVSKDEINKRCFNLQGNLISKVKDKLLPDESIKRESGNLTIYYNKNNEIKLTERNINFEPIKKDIKNKTKLESSWLPNSNIGVLDLETYEEDSIGKCYAIGFYSPIDEKCKTFYINKNKDSVDLIHNCFKEMLRPKYKNITFYAHNLGGFDAIFIIKNLTLFNKEEKENPYIIDSITRNSDILKLTIKRKIEGKIRTVTIQDSVAILPRSLRDLCKDFKINTIKSHFPYDFCNENTLFYKGKTPDIIYYKNITHEEYNNLYREVWDLEKECIKYLEIDLLSLYEVLVKVNKTIHLLFNIQMTECLTISSLAIKIYLSKYYDKNEKPIPLIINKGIFDNIHKAYYGGRVEVYKPKVEGIAYYYDINSLYPYASLNPIPGVNCKFIECINQTINLKDLFGFFYCRIKSNNNYLGLLPFRTETGLIFPVGEWEGWYFSEELKFAEQNGYEIEIIKGYNFDVVDGAFTNFVNDIYKIKNDPSNQTNKNVAKLILNSLIGRFGMNFHKNISNIVDKKKHDHLSVSRILKNSIEIDYDTYLDTYKPSIDKEVCNEFNVDYINILNNENFDEISSIKTYKSVSISTAAAILSYARIVMSKIKLYILNNKGNIYYTDTDSIVTDIKLPDEFVDQRQLGKLKLEHIITEGYFLADKTYAFKNEKGEIFKRAKSINSSSLNFEDYKNMYDMKIINNAVRTSSIKDYRQGSVVIRDSNVIFNTTTYNKRNKIFNNSIWIDTKPISLNYKQ